MTSACGRFTLAFNGEIYNFPDLRSRLVSAGITLRTRSDTEVLLEGLACFGLPFLQDLAGMFAFALWDSLERTLWLVRDRFGVKPLYWATANDTLLFGSELSSIMASGLVSFSPSPEALAHFLGTSFIPGEQSAVQGVFRLPPAHLLRWRPDSAPKISCWWNMAEIWRRQTEAPTGDDQELLTEFSRLLELGVRQRMISDVPLGGFLSGGIDSNTIVAHMVKLKKEINTFSIGFSASSFDESVLARESAQHLRTHHSEAVVSPESPEILLDIIERLDEPFGDTSIIPTFLLCRGGRRQVTVALSGDGGDELLAGYITLQADRIYSRFRHFPEWLISPLKYVMEHLPENREKVNTIFKAKQFLRGYPRHPAEAHGWWRMSFSPETLAEIFPTAMNIDLFRPFRRAYAEGHGLGFIDRFLYVDYKTWLPDDILYKVDRASMNNSMEVRSPFLDHRLVEFAMKIPAHLKRQGPLGKILLRRHATNLLPPSILARPKSGFNAPVSDWLCGPWRELVEDCFSSARLESSGLQPVSVQRLWREHRAGHRDHGYKLFNILVLQLWLNFARKRWATAHIGD